MWRSSRLVRKLLVLRWHELQVGLHEDSHRRGQLRLRMGARRVWVDVEPLELTAREYALLEALFVRHKQVVSRSQLMEAVTDWESDLSDNGLDISMHRLRRKIVGSGARIRTIRGLGYLLEEAVDNP